jgi:hypothetical protein
MNKTISSYGEIKRINLSSFGQPLHQVKDFSTKKILKMGEKDFVPLIKKELTISGKSFIIDLIEDKRGYAHFHFIYDKIAQYEFIKKYDPDINLYILTNSNYLQKEKSLVHDLKTLYKIPDSNIFDMDSGEKYIFKKLFFIWPTFNSLFHNVFVTEYFDPWSNKKDFKFYIQTIYPLLQSRFRAYIKPQVDPDLKIFISRFNHHEKRGRNKDSFRYISKNDEIKLEDFFMYKGYKIYAVEDLGLLEQVELYSGAYRIAGIKSSGLVNIIFCKKESEIIAINLDDEYRAWHDYICLFAGLKYTELPAIYNEEGTTWSYSIFKSEHKRKAFSFNEIENSLLENSALL